MNTNGTQEQKVIKTEVFCPKCNAKVKGHEMFCLQCGEKLTEWPEDPKARLKNCLSPKQLGMSFVWFCLVGLVASIFMMLPRWIIGLITRFGTGAGVAEGGIGFILQNLLTALFGMAVCFIAVMILFCGIGENDMVFVRNMGYTDRKMNVLNTFLCIGIVAIVYYALMAIINQPFFTGLVMYLTFLISNCDPQQRYTELGRGVQLLALLIHVLVLVPGAYLGYKKGYNEELARLIDAEEEEANRLAKEKTAE